MVKVNNKIDQPTLEKGFYAKAYCFFNRHSGNMRVVFLLLFMVLGILAFCKIYSNFKLVKMQRAHIHLPDRASKVSFAEKYGYHPLGGMVLLELVSEAFYEKNYKLASTYYSRAKEALRGTELATHSKILYALSLFNLGENEKSLAILDKVIRDKLTDECSRAKALHRYICCAKETGRADKISEITQYSKGLNMSNGWLKRIDAELN
jgi:tetratricopeptide (TPR) repeat protein